MDRLFIEARDMYVEIRIVGNKIDFGKKFVEIIPVSGFVKERKWVEESSILKSASIKKILQQK